MFRFEQIRSLDSVLGLEVDGTVGSQEAAEASIKAHAQTLAELLQKNWDAARNGRQVQIERLLRRDAACNVQDVDFEIGDFVLVYVLRQRNKLRVKWTGPFHRAADTINAAVYIYENVVTGNRTAVHTSRLRVPRSISIF